MKKIKDLVVYHVKDYIKPLTIAYIFLFIFSLLIFYSTRPVIWDSSTIDSSYVPTTSIMYMDSWIFRSLTLVIIFIVTVSTYKSNLKQFSQNGITRKEFYLTKILTLMIVSFMTTIFSGLSQIVKYFMQIKYYDEIHFENINRFLIFFLVFIFIGIVAMFIATIVTKIGFKKALLLYILFYFGSRFISMSLRNLFTLSEQVWIMDNFFWFIPQGELPFQYLWIIYSIISLTILIGTYLILQKTEITE